MYNNFLEHIRSLENKGRKNKQLIKAFQNISLMTVESDSLLRMYYWMNNENKYRVGLALIKILKNSGSEKYLLGNFIFP